MKTRCSRVFGFWASQTSLDPERSSARESCHCSLAGDCVANLEAEFRAGGCRNGLTVNGHAEAVPNAGNGEDGRVLVVTHGSAQFRDRGSEGAVNHDHVRPDGLEELFLGYDFTGVEEKLEQNFQRLRFEVDRLMTRNSRPNSSNS